MKPTRRRFVKLSSVVCLGIPSISRLMALCATTPGPFSGPGSEPRPVLPTLNEEISTAAGKVRLSMLFEGQTPEELAVWQKKFSAKLHELLGPNSPPKKWSAQSLATATFDAYTREELLLTSEGVPSLPLYVLRPRSAGSAKFPLVLCLHGHGKGGHDPVVGRDDTPDLAAEIKKFLNFPPRRKPSSAGCNGLTLRLDILKHSNSMCSRVVTLGMERPPFHSWPRF